MWRDRRGAFRTAAQVVPTDMELAALSKSVLPKTKQMKMLKPQVDSDETYLDTLYTVLAHQTGNPLDREVDRAIKTLIKEAEDADLGTVHLIAKGLLSPSEPSDKALQAALSTTSDLRRRSRPIDVSDCETARGAVVANFL